jgi:hypothetical protein
MLTVFTIVTEVTIEIVLPFNVVTALVPLADTIPELAAFQP